MGAALAAEAILFAPGGDPLPGEAVELRLVAWGEDGGPLPGAPRLLHGVERVPLSTSWTPGVWSATWRAPEGDALFTLLAEGHESRVLRLAMGEPPVAGLTLAPISRGLAGGAPVLIGVEGEDLPPPEALEVTASEGRVRSVARAGSGLQIAWEPGESGRPRAVPLAVREGRRPGAPPVWTTVLLSARPPIEITRSEPGANVTLTVGERVYGPVVVDEDGVATLTPDVHPGELTARAELVDDLGNRRINTITLVPDPHPGLTAATSGPITPDHAPPPIHLMAVDLAGRPWAGPAPTCAASAADDARLEPEGPGRWRVTLARVEPGLFLDLRVDCEIAGEATASARLAVGAGRPERLVLRVYPDQLSADFPVAQVQAYLEDARGERLPPDGVSLRAEHGELELLTPGASAIRAEYVGDGAGDEDTLIAAWSAPPARGRAQSLELGRGEVGGAPAALVRARDALGRPLIGARVYAGEAAAETDERGIAAFPLADVSRPRVFEVTSGDAVRRAALVPWAEMLPLDAARSDLEARRRLPIQAGRVREVRISAEPPVLYTGTGDTALIRVQLLDRAGLAVTDEPASIQASEGEVGATRVREDGSLVATFAPPAGYAAGEVVLTAAGDRGGFSASTTLELRPRPLERSLTFSGGYLGGLAEISAPFLALDYDRRLPLLGGALLARVTLGGWRDLAVVEDPDRGEDIELTLDTAMIAAAAIYRWEQGAWSAWGGLGALLAPYRLESRFAGSNPLRAAGLHPPGATSTVGVGRRIAGGELTFDLRGVGVQAQADTLGYDGQIGGLALSLGYRLIY